MLPPLPNTQFFESVFRYRLWYETSHEAIESRTRFGKEFSPAPFLAHMSLWFAVGHALSHRRMTCLDEVVVALPEFHRVGYLLSALRLARTYLALHPY